MERLDKLLASQGQLSRKQGKELIRGGRVTVNGQTARAPEQKVGGQDAIAVDGKVLQVKKHLYIMMNKPAGVISATKDDKERTALDLLPVHLRRGGLFPAGRLDKDTEGFLLITDDGDFAHRMLSPKRHVPKTYLAAVDGPIGEEICRAFAAGVALDGGDTTSPAELRVLSQGKGEAEAELTIYEGMYHQVKRMFAAFGLHVTYLKRTKIGNLFLDENLSPGECREILDKERKKIC